MSGADSVLCPECGELVSPKFENNKVVVTVRKEEFSVEVKRAVCVKCGAKFGTGGREFDENAVAYDRYRIKNKYLFPDKIKAIRNKYALNQKSFSRVLGAGENLIHLYEKGALPDKTHIELIKQAENPDVMKNLYEDSKDAVTPEIRKEFEKRIHDFLREKQKNKLKDVVLSAFDYAQSEYSGFRKFNIDIVSNAFLIMLKEKSPLTTTHLGKILCYVDFIKFKDQSVSLTGCRYVAGKHGPFLNDYKKLLYYLTDAEILKSEIDSLGSGEQYIPLRKPDETLFSGYDLDLIRKVTNAFGSMKTNDLSKKTHDEFPGWSENKIGNLISFETAKDIRL